MLSLNELSNLQVLINDEKNTFGTLKNKINTLLDKSLYFKLIITLTILIKDQKLNLFQEIVAIYILYYLSEKQKYIISPQEIAFYSLKKTKMETKKFLLCNFLKNKHPNWDDNIYQYVENASKNCDKVNSEDSYFLYNLQKMYKYNNKLNNLMINPIVDTKKIGENVSNIKFKTNNDDISLNFFETNYMEYYPSSSNNIIFKNEANWIVPMLKHNYLWTNNSYEKLNYLLNQALNDTPLTKEDAKYIISTIEKNPNVIQNINFNPQKMMNLIEKNESVSFEILSVLCKISLNE